MKTEMGKGEEMQTQMQARTQKEKVGKVTEDERKEIQRLHERRSALKELYLTLASPYLDEEERRTLYERIIDDLEKTISQYDSWWREIPKKYQWKSKEKGHWIIDFETNVVYLEDEEGECIGKENCNGCTHS